jgi:PilZ domain
MTENLNFDQFSEMGRTDACEPAIIRTDRRTTHRTNSEALAYIHLEPDSGAIVLNVSDGGLAFHAVAPIHQSGIIKFWFSLHADHRIEGSGELAWTDATKKTGGLRFNSLPTEVREQIRKWVLQSGTTLKPKSEMHIAAQGPSCATPELTPRETPIAAAESSTPPYDPPAIVRELPTIELVRGSEIVVLPAALKASNEPPVVNASAATTKSIPEPRKSHRGSARESEPREGVRPPAATRRTILLNSPARTIGRASGAAVFVAILVAATALIYHQKHYQAPVGLAEQFAPAGDLRAATNDVSLPATDHAVDMTTTPISTAKSELASEISKLEAEYQEEEPRRPRPPAKPSRSVPARASSPTTSSEAASDPSLALQRPETDSATRPNPVPDGSAGPLPAAGVTGAAEVGGPKAQTSKPQPRPRSQEFRTATRPDVDSQQFDRQPEVLFSGTGKYFDVGNFSDVVWAERARDELERVGFHSLVIHKTRLWLSSYHVVVGPYSDAEWATAQEDLKARGFKPRLFK